VSDTLVRPIPHPVRDDQQEPQRPVDSAATRHLCAGVYVDRSFRDLIIRQVHNDARRRIAPSYGFDLVPVVRHAWRSWLIDISQLLAMLGGLLTGLAMGGLLAAVTVWCALALSLLLRGIIREFPQVVRLQVEAVAERWGRAASGLRHRRLSEPGLPSRKRLLKAMLTGCVLVALVPFIASYVLNLPITSAIRPAIATGCVLVACAVVTGIVRQVFLNGIAYAQTVRPSQLTRREKVVDLQQNHPCVIYHRPPHQDVESDPLDLLTNTDVPSPFLGSGNLVNRWLPPLTVQLLRPGKGSLKEREYTRPPFSAHALVEALRTALKQLGTDPGEENLPGLEVRDRIYIAAADFPAESRLTRPNLGKLEIWGFIDNHRSYGHHFLETSVPIYGGELVATVLLRVSLKGRCLSLDVATCALTRTPDRFHEIDRYRAMGAMAMLRSAIRSAINMPVDVLRLWRLLEAPMVLGRSWWALRDRSTVPRRRSIGPRLAVREEKADTWDNTHLDRTTIYDHMKIVEQRILKATEDFLDEHGVDTSAFEKQATNIINSGVLNMGGGQMSIGQLAAGIGAQLINNGPEGASA
jgi:hypothetical protein